MKLRYFYVLILLILLLITASLAGARVLGRHLPTNYNCLRFDNIDVQLNRHLNIYEQKPAVYNSGLLDSYILDSPDGNYRLIISHGPNPVYFVEDRRTGLFTTLHEGSESYIDLAGIAEWSADSRFVAYRVSHNYSRDYTVELYSLESQKTISLGPTSGVFDFSPDSQFLSMGTAGGIEIISLRTFQPEFPISLQFKASSYYSNSRAWAPGGHYLAFITVDRELHLERLIIIDVDARTVQEFLLLEFKDLLLQGGVFQYYLFWSTDGRYLVVQAVDYRPGVDFHDFYFDIFSVDGGKIGHISQQSNMEKADYQKIAWSEQTRQFYYFTYQVPENYTLWAFEPDTGKHYELESGITQFDFDNSSLSTLKSIGTGIFLTIRALDGLTAPAHYVFAPHQINSCNWTIDTDLLFCSPDHYSSTNTFLFRRDGTKIWPHDSLKNITDYHWYPSSVADGGQFAAYTFEQDGEKVLEVFDLETGRSYRFPKELHDTLPEDVLQGYNPWSLSVFPSPDGRISIVSLDGQSLYRFWPEQNHWELVFRNELSSSEGVTQVLWSPDGKRFAFLRSLGRGAQTDLYVREAEDDREWYLGYFPEPENMSWQQCGGVRTALFGDFSLGLGR